MPEIETNHYLNGKVTAGEVGKELSRTKTYSLGEPDCTAIYFRITRGLRHRWVSATTVYILLRVAYFQTSKPPFRLCFFIVIGLSLDNLYLLDLIPTVEELTYAPPILPLTQTALWVRVLSGHRQHGGQGQEDVEQVKTGEGLRRIEEQQEERQEIEEAMERVRTVKSLKRTEEQSREEKMKRAKNLRQIEEREREEEVEQQKRTEPRQQKKHSEEMNKPASSSSSSSTDTASITTSLSENSGKNNSHYSTQVSIIHQ